MIELPEAINLSSQINEKFSGRHIISAKAAVSPHRFAWYAGDPMLYESWLSDRDIISADSVGGQVILRLDGGGINFSDGTLLRYNAPDAKRPIKHQLILELDDGSALTCSIQMYGGIIAFDGANYDNDYVKAAYEKPSPLSDEFTPEYFNAMFHETSENLTAKAFLATKQRIPGLGNGVLQDILYTAKISPMRKLSLFDDDMISDLYDSVRSVLREMTDKGGRNVETDIYGEPGSYITQCSRFTVNTPCPICGNLITKKQYMGGVVYFCPYCQHT